MLTDECSEVINHIIEDETKTIEESTGSYFNKLKRSFDTEKRNLSHGVREYSRDEIYGKNYQVQNKTYVHGVKKKVTDT